MSQLYGRVFLQILDSSIAEDFTLRHVFEDFLKLSEDGVVDMTRQSLSRRLNIPLKVLNREIEKLESEDKASRDDEFSGKRLERLDDHRDWGWRILNWEKYELLRTRADVAERVRRHREKKKTGGDISATGSEIPVIPEKLSTSKFTEEWDAWVKYRMGMKKPKNWDELFKAQLKWLEQYDPETAAGILLKSRMNGYQGIFEPKEKNANNTGSKIGGKPNPRLEGVTRGPTDYAAAYKRKAAQNMVGQVAQAGTQKPVNP